jgi:DNA processing protein
VLDKAGFEAWFRLLETPGVSRAQARRLLTRLGPPEAVLAAPRALLESLLGADTTQALLQGSATLTERLAAAHRWLAAAPEHHVLALGDPYYPPLLLQAPDPPLLLYVQGNPQAMAGRGVAVVGSRNATPQGCDNARAFAAALSRQGLVVFSGLAQGIDAAAHEGALASCAAGGAPTAAVVGTGLDLVYPKNHTALARRIAQTGALVSEYAPGTPALPPHFPQRNRILAGLSLGTLVVEAAMKSGSLITARLAAEAGREVFAVPGSIHAPQSKGCHDLLKQGAKLVETAQDILEELEHGAGPRQATLTADRAPDTPAAPLRPALMTLLQALGTETMDMDSLSARTGWGAPDLSALLLELELEGRVARLPGGRFEQRFSG